MKQRDNYARREKAKAEDFIANLYKNMIEVKNGEENREHIGEHSSSDQERPG